MNILTLSIKQKFFDEIKNGTKKTEIREIRPNTSKKYIRYECDGKESIEDNFPDDAEVKVIPVKYDAIKFLTGEYKGIRPSMLVEVKRADIQILTDEEENDIVYDYEGEEYLASQIVYGLGNIINQ